MIFFNIIYEESTITLCKEGGTPVNASECKRVRKIIPVKYKVS